MLLKTSFASQCLIEISSVPMVLLNMFSRLDQYFLVEFLGRTELRVGDVVAGCEERRGPVTRSVFKVEFHFFTYSFHY